MNTKKFLSTLCVELGLNTAHDYDGVESESDIELYSSAIIKEIRRMRSIIIIDLDDAGEENILLKSNMIVNHRSEEKEREYGPFNESMDRMRDIFNALTGENLKTEHMFMAMVALKFSREHYSHKKDNLLDAVSYIAGLDNYMDSKN